jgi:four helix bundle protein
MKADQKTERVDLRVRTKQFALRVIRLFCALPKRSEVDVIGKQILRAGTSVGANFREAHRARSNAEFLSKLGDCLKELEEPATGWSCWSREKSFQRIDSHRCKTSVINSSPFSLRSRGR